MSCGVIALKAWQNSSHSIRTMLLALPLLMLDGCRPAIAQEMPLRSEDYTTARKHFQTHLLKHGPSPQPGDPLHPPAGAQQVEYSPGLHLQAWITPPGKGLETGTKKPAVLFLHGHCSVDKSDWELTQPYRKAGYILMLPVLRGENGQRGDYSMFYNEVDDVLAAADYLAKLPNVDAKHIYLAGHSVGGTLTLLAALTSPRFRAAASFSGAPDVKIWSKYQKELIVFDPSNAQEFQMRSPIAFATSFQCPVRLYCGRSEPIFSRLGQQTSERAKKKGLDVEAIRVPGDHFTAVPAEIRQSIRFFRSH
jgi:dienelactone hydrolase